MKNYLGGRTCDCGREHDVLIDDVVIGEGVISRIPQFLLRYECRKAFILADCNTYTAAGAAVCTVLESSGILFEKFIFPQESLEPDEAAVGSAVMHFDPSCDIIIAVGSGVINDIGKILSNVTGRKYIIVATAPSMDGYASATSSMTVGGLKVSLKSRCADVIIGDIAILKNAPLHMLQAGIGDMLAKYISIAEWRIAHIITGEYYCERVAQLIRDALKKCVDHADSLMKRNGEAVRAVFEGLVVGGVAMAYAGVSRPASGVEHYFSHIWDMRGAALGTQVDFHGIQCAIGTLIAARLYEAVKVQHPDWEKAASYVDKFSWEDWKDRLKSLLGDGADAMIALEEKEQKYDKSTHPDRFRIIEENWEKILRILAEEIPSYGDLAGLMDTIGISKDLASLGVDSQCAKMTFQATKDIRDKYVLSRLAWDLGILDELCELL